MKNRIIWLIILFSAFIPHLQAKDYNILDFGAKEDRLSTEAIQKAIDECSAAGGGRVIVPAGTFITGTVFLKSNVNLNLENGSVLKGSTNLNDYSRVGRSPGIIYCEDAVNVGISGKGTIDGSGDSTGKSENETDQHNNK
jgi:polygalacturonase